MIVLIGLLASVVFDFVGEVGNVCAFEIVGVFGFIGHCLFLFNDCVSANC